MYSPPSQVCLTNVKPLTDQRSFLRSILGTWKIIFSYKPGQNSKGGLMHLHPKHNKVLPLYSIWHEVNNVLILWRIKRRLESCAKWSSSVVSSVASNFTPTPWSRCSDFCVVYDLVLTGINFNLCEVNESWSGGGKRFCLTWLGEKPVPEPKSKQLEQLAKMQPPPGQDIPLFGTSSTWTPLPHFLWVNGVVLRRNTMSLHELIPHSHS